MSISPEARMGNDIARQLAHLPADRAAEAVASHLESFWEPGMRRRLVELAAAGDDSLDPLLAAAAALLSHDAPRAAAPAPSGPRA